MFRFLNTLAVFLALSACALAQNQVATVTSIVPFELRGATVSPGQGVLSWPVMAGDIIKSGSGTVTISFTDASVVLAANSTGKVETGPSSGKCRNNSQNPVPRFELVSGSAKYSRTNPCAIALVAMGKTVGGNSVTGGLGGGTGGAVGATGLNTSAVVLAAAVGATGLGIGIAQVVSSGSPVSPSN
jgi:hypothetical protein